jgi:hypothetical protein
MPKSSGQDLKVTRAAPSRPSPPSRPIKRFVQPPPAAPRPAPPPPTASNKLAAETIRIAANPPNWASMIKIVRGAEVSPGIWEYFLPSLALRGKSRQPLLDACRQIKRGLGSTAERAGVFREGSDVVDISCPVEAGALLTVSERDKGGVRFEKYREVDFAKVFDRVPAAEIEPTVEIENA